MIYNESVFKFITLSLSRLAIGSVISYIIRGFYLHNYIKLDFRISKMTSHSEKDE